MRHRYWISGCTGLALVSGAVSCSEAALDQASAGLKASAATISISAEAGSTCELACFDVLSDKDIGFIALDATLATDCASGSVELSLFAVDEAGATSPLALTPVPHGKGKSCPGIPATALKFDELSGGRYTVCAVGADSAGVYVKSGTTCAARSFELGAAELCAPDGAGWLRDMGAASLAAESDVSADPGGNVVYAGPGGVTKLDATGTLRWQVPRGERVASDSAGNVVVAGTFDAPIDVGVGRMLASEGGTDVFVLKLDRLGHPLWATRFGTPASESAESVAVDPSGRIAVGITGLGTRVLGPGGELLFAKSFAGALAFDAAGNLAVTGAFSGTLDVGGGPVASSGGSDAFVVELDSAGNHRWSHFFGDAAGHAGEQRGTSTATDSQGNVLIVGEVSESIGIFGTDYVLPTSPESSNRGAYIAKLDESGEPVWATVRTFTEDMLDVATDSSGSVYVTGGDVGNVSPFRYYFVEKRDPSGTLEWKLGSMSSSERGRGLSIALDACDNPFWSRWWVEGTGPGLTGHAVLAKLER